MTDVDRFFITWIGSCAIIFLVVMVGAGLFFISERVIVFALRTFGIQRFFKAATQIAAIIEAEPERWRFEQYRATYEAIGTISWITYLKVETSQGTWTPNRIERRIIRKALDRTITARVRERVAQAAGA